MSKCPGLCQDFRSSVMKRSSMLYQVNVYCKLSYGRKPQVVFSRNLNYGPITLDLHQWAVYCYLQYILTALFHAEISFYAINFMALTIADSLIYECQRAKTGWSKTTGHKTACSRLWMSSALCFQQLLCATVEGIKADFCGAITSNIFPRSGPRGLL